MSLELEAEEITADLFVGRWIGETQGSEMPAHIWEIKRLGQFLQINTKWEGKTRVVTFQAEMSTDEPAFILPPTPKDKTQRDKATLVDRQHFVVPKWCTNNSRGGEGPDYDVIFSRPGIAELTARKVYDQYLRDLAQGETT